MLALESFGSFYIGGKALKIAGQPVKQVLRNDHVRVEVNPNGEYSNGAMYVQFYKPTKSTGVYLLIHGGGLSGAFWESSTANRKSWVEELLACGKTVYVIDVVGSGRSGYCPNAPQLEGKRIDLRTNERTWTHFRFGTINNQGRKSLFPGLQNSEKNFYGITKHNIPRWNNYVEPTVQAVRELLSHELDWSVIAHSQGADIAMRFVTDPRVKDILLIEPAAFPEVHINSKAKDKTVGFLYGDNIEKSQFWSDMLVKGKKYIEHLRGRGVDVKELRLPDAGIVGNTHLIVHDNNSQQIFYEMMSFMGWQNRIGENVSREQCKTGIKDKTAGRSMSMVEMGISFLSLFCDCMRQRKDCETGEQESLCSSKKCE